MTVRDWFDLIKIYAKKDQGQTMAEYGVVLAVITALVVVAILALSGAIAAALDRVRGYL